MKTVYELDLPQFLNAVVGYSSMVKLSNEAKKDFKNWIGQEIELIAFEGGKYFKFADKKWVPTEKEDADHIKIKVFAAGIFQEYNPVHFGADFPDTKSALKFWEQIERRWVKFTQEDLVLGFEKI